jgi:two-component system, NtrC family, sensor histidine kinase HydH
VPPTAVAGPIKPRGSAARWSRIAVVAALGGMAIALTVLVYFSDVSVREASRMVIRGEASTLYLGVRDRIQPQEIPIKQRLENAIRDLESKGLRYIATTTPDGIEAEAGRRTLDPAALLAWMETTEVGVPEAAGDRVRVRYRRPRGLGGDGRLDTPKTDGLVFELEARTARQLSDSATRTLAIGIAASLTLLGLTILLVRWSLGREAAVRELERERHLAHLGQMSAVLAHEIRNPLASLKGNAQLLAGGLAGERAQAKAERVVDEATRLETLTNDLLEFARAGHLKLADVDPVDLARDAAALGGDRIRLDADGAPRSWPLDAARMRQVLVNLIENAVELSEGPVDVTVVRADRAVVFAVADRGPGIPDADLDKVFEPFFTKRTRGTGLGLAVARRLVELHGGTIRARHRDGGGTVFEVVIPR